MSTDDERARVIVGCIARSRSGLEPEVLEAALEYWYLYAQYHQFFTGADVLESWRQVPGSYAHGDWRNAWGGVSSMAGKAWCTKIGRKRVKNLHSHVESLVEWESNIFLGVRAARPKPVDMLKRLEMEVGGNFTTIEQALMKAYTMGVERR